MPSRPSSSTRAPVSASTAGSVTARHRAAAEARGVPGEAQEAVRLVTPQVGLDEAVGDERGVVVGTPSATSIRVPRSRSRSGEIRSSAIAAPSVVARVVVYSLAYNPASVRRCDVQPHGPARGAPGGPRRVPRRDHPERRGVGARRARMSPVRRLLPSRATRTASCSTSSTTTPRPSRRTSRRRTSRPGGRSPTGCSPRRSTRPAALLVHQQRRGGRAGTSAAPARRRRRWFCARRRSSASTAATASSPSRSSASGTARTTRSPPA